MQKKFKWKNEYSVNINSIDSQHQNFFEITNKIMDLASQEKLDRTDLLISLGKLRDYATYHLTTEEDYFDKINYPEAEWHINEHDQYRNQMNDYLDQAQNEDINTKELAREIALYSSEWLAMHILSIDKKYTQYFNENGIK